MSRQFQSGLIALCSYFLPGLVSRHRPVGVKDHSAPLSRRPVRSGRIGVLVILPLLILLVSAPPILAADYDITGPGDQTVNVPGTADDDTVNVSGFNAANLLSGTWDGQGGTNTINLDGEGTLQATISNFQVLNKTGTGTWLQDTDLNLGATGAVTIDEDMLEVANTRTLTSNTITVQENGVLGIDTSGTVNCTTLTVDLWGYVGVAGTATAGTASITGELLVGDNGVFNGQATTINNFGWIGVGSLGTFNYDTLTVDLIGTMELLGTATATTSTTISGSVAVWSGGVLNGAATALNDWGYLYVDGGGTFNYTTLTIDWAATMELDGTATATTSSSITGEVYVWNGAVWTGGATTINDWGWVGVDSGATFNYTTLTVAAGGMVELIGTATATTSTTIAGEVYVYNGGILNGLATTINNGGLLQVETASTLNATTLVVDTGGAFNLTGDATLTTSATVGGTARINGTLISPVVTVGATGLVQGTGQITGNLTNNGTVAPGNSIGTLTVTGNYVQGAGGTLQIEINSNGTNDLLHATGTANLAGTLNVVRQGNYTGTNQHVVLQADGGITGTFDGVSGGSLRHRYGLTYTATQVIVGVTVLTYESLVRSYGGRPVDVAKSLDAIANSANGDMATIIYQLDNLPDVGSLAAALQQLHCGPYHAFKNITFNTQHLFVALGQSRMYQLRTGIPVTNAASGLYNPTTGPLLAYSADLGRLGRLLSSEGAPAAVKDRTAFAGPPSDVFRNTYTGHGIGIWVRPFGIVEEQDSTSDLTGYEFTTTGFAAGFDYRFSPHFIAGVSLGYATTQVKYDDAGESRGKVQSYSAGVYGTWFGPRWFIEFSVSYASNSFDMDRRIMFGGVNRLASSDYNGFAVTAQLGGGYDFPIGRSWTVGPVLSLEAVYQENESFSETGAGALNLTVDRRTATSVRSAVGVRVKRVWRGTEGRRVTVSLSALWVHEFANDAQSVNASMQGNPATPFTVTTPEPERDALRLGIGITARVSHRVSLFAAYQPELKKGNQSHYLSTGIRIEF